MDKKSHFHFKRFSISHERSAMKVGTDAVLLATWVNIGRAIHILDIGTGSGVIALILAQRSDENSRIDAVEVSNDEVTQAQENFLRSPWPFKFQIHHSALQDFVPENNFDLIVSNPPYFNKSLSPSDKKRYQARHTVNLSYAELIMSVARLLTETGKFNVILPFEEGVEFIALAKKGQLFCSRQYSFRTRPQKPIERWLLEFSKIESEAESGEILLYSQGEVLDQSYRDLVKDFYLKL